MLDNTSRAFQAFNVVMNFIFCKKFSAVCVGLVLGARLFAEPTNATAPADATAQNAVNGYLQIQAQLHDTQAAIENNNAAMNARIQSLEQTIAAQGNNAAGLAQKNLESAQKTQQVMLTLVAAFGSVGLATLLLLVYFQWRVVKRLVEMPAMQAPVLALGNGAVSLPPAAGAAVAESNTRLFGAVDQMQKRILELEQATHAALPAKIPAAKNGSHKPAEIKNGDATTSDREECVANLIAEGQALMDTGNAEKALDCFDVAVGLDAKHVDALVKKGGALEKLGRTDEAIACYDRAIEADNAATIAYLQKGGLFNRLARYDEALKCYEQALRTQEKSTVVK